MKKFLLILIAFFSLNLSHGQSQMVTVTGTVFDSAGSPVPNHHVWYEKAFASNGFVIDVFTDVNGIYFDTTMVTTNTNFRVKTEDCNGDTNAINSVYHFISPSTDSVITNFTICASPPLPCIGTISQNLNGLTGNFYVNTAQQGGTFSWTIDSAQYNGDTVTHNFPGPGVYGICVSYSSVLCSFTVCDSVIIQNQNCTASWTYSVSPPATVTFTPSVNPAPTANSTFFWTFGDGSISNVQFPTHIYANPGTYLVCLTYSDSSSNCSINTCDTIYIAPPSCTASFSYQNFSPAFAFLGSSNLGGPVVAYNWDFGDGNTSQGMNAVHLYQNPGSYLVCLTATDNTSSCNFCDSIIVTVDTSSLRLGGQIGGNAPNSVFDRLILYEETGSASAPFIAPLDTTLNIGGTFSFSGLSSSNYLVKAIPNNPDRIPGMMPVYWPDKNYWGEATSLLLNSNINSVSFMITGIPTVLSGPGSITVSTRDAQNQRLEGVTVWLEDINQNVLAYEISSATQDISFNDLPFTDYRVRADYPGYYMFNYPLSLSGSNPSENLDLFINGNWLTTSISDENMSDRISLFPNPASDHFMISSDLNIEEIGVSDLSGKAIEATIAKSGEQYRIELMDPQSGLYIVTIKTEKGLISRKLIIERN